MKILAMDSSAASCGSAVVQDGRVTDEIIVNKSNMHSECFQEACNLLLKSAGLKYEDMDYFSVTTGPGSFTGVRIGVTAAKLMGFACGKKLIPLSSLEVLSCPSKKTAENSAVWCLIGARHRRVYSAVYRNCVCFGGEKLGEVDDIAPFQFEEAASQGIRNLFLSGDAAEKYFYDVDIRKIAASHGIEFHGIYETLIRPYEVGLLAYKKLSENKDSAKTAGEIIPCYLSLSSAEKNLRNSAAKNAE